MLQQPRSASGNRRARIHQPGAFRQHLQQLVGQQREVRTTKDHGIRRLRHAQPRAQHAAERLQRDRFTVQFRLGNFHQFRRSQHFYLAFIGKARNQLMRIRTLNGSAGREQPYHTVRRQTRRRFDSRHYAHHRKREFFTQGRERYRTGRVAGDNGERQGVARLNGSHNLDHTLNDKRFAFLAIGECNVIESVDVMQIRQELPDLIINRKPTHAGIKNQNGWAGLRRCSCLTTCILVLQSRSHKPSRNLYRTD